MKTNLVICLALLAATSTLPAEQKGRAFQGNARLQQGAVKRVMPTQQAKARIAPPKVAKSPALNRNLTRATATVPGQSTRPAGSVNRNTNIPSDNRIPGNSAALNEGRNVANGVREMDALRNSGLENLRENFGTGGNQPHGQQTPTDPFANDSFTPRDPKAPAGVTRNDNGGLTDIRGSAENSSKGNGASGRPMSAFGRILATSGPRTGRVSYGSNGNDRYSVNYTGVGDDGTHSTTEHRNDNGRTSGYSDIWSTTDENGTRTTTETYDANGRFTGSETVFENNDGSVQSKAVDADGSVLVTTRDSSGQVTQSTAEGSGPPPARDERSGDRTPDGIGTGGPVGPSAATVSGLVPLDLLRQRANGESSGSGPGQYSIAGRTGANQVLPGGTAHTPGPRVASQNTIVNPGPIDSTPGSGDDRP